MQQDIFSVLYKKYIITKPIRLIELFGGYGSQHFALEYLGVNFEHYKLVEWAVKSIQAYKDAHYQNDNNDYSKELSKDELIDYLYNKHISMDYNQPMTLKQIKSKNEEWLRVVYNNIIATKNIVDIQNTKANDLEIVDTDKYDYIMTYSFPCQDLSLAGLGKGMARDSGTRSGMLWEVERILDECKELPQILLMENVPEVKGTNNVKYFNEWQSKLESLGYKNYHQNLIATDYGIPQTRNRTFMISILGDYSYTFPKPIPLKLKLKDLLEKEVDEKYYLSDKFLNYCTDMTDRNGFVRGERFNPINPEINDKAYTVTTGAGNRPTDNFIIIPEDTKKGYVKAKDGDGVYINRPHQKRGVVQKGKIQTLKTSGEDIGVVVGTYQYSKSDNFMQGKDRLKLGKEVSDTLQTSPKEGVVIKDNSIYNIFFIIFDLCCIIDTKEKDKYERSRELLQILWQEIGKKEIWQEVRRFISIQEKKILQQNLYENGIHEDRKPQSKVSSSTPNSSKYNENITNREKMLNMWEDWKTRYTPQRWELSEQQFRQFNLFMQELSYETTQGETSMQDMWQTNERFRILQQTLFKIQEIWKPIENQISNGLRIRKLTPRETFRLMGVKDEDYERIAKNQSNSSLYHLAGDSVVVNVLMAIFKELLKDD